MSKRRSFLNLALPAYPATTDAGLHSELTKLYNALQNIAGALDNNQSKFSVIYQEEVGLGEMVSIYPSGTGKTLYARKAVNTTPARYCAGYCCQDDADVGVAGEVIGFGVHPYVNGLTPGTRYFLSSTPGGITPTMPTASGTFVQPIGFAVSDTQLFMNPVLQIIANP